MSTLLERGAPVVEETIEVPVVEEPPELVVLKQVRELLSDERRWCQGQFAEDQDGFGVAVDSPWATRWCAAGAIYRLVGHDQVLLHAIEKRITEVFGYGSLTRVNDVEGREAILAGLDLLIERGSDG